MRALVMEEIKEAGELERFEIVLPTACDYMYD